MGGAVEVRTHQHAAAAHRLFGVGQLFNHVFYQVFGLHLVGKAHVAPHNESEGEYGQNQRSNELAVEQKRGKKRRGGEGNDRGEQPTSDDVDDAGHSVHGGLLAPGAVCKGRSHTHHKHHKRGAERKPKARGVGNQGRRQQEVDAAPHVVKGGLGTRIARVLGLGEARVGPRTDARARKAREYARNGQSRRSDAAADRIGLEFLGAFALTSQVDFGFAHLSRFGVGPQRHNHDSSGDQQNTEGRGDLFSHAIHHQEVRIHSARRVDLVRLEGGQGRPNKVDQIVAGKGHGQRKRSKEHHVPQRIHSAVHRQLSQQRKSDKKHPQKQVLVSLKPSAQVGIHEHATL